jgi:hypothetical protein
LEATSLVCVDTVSVVYGCQETVVGVNGAVRLGWEVVFVGFCWVEGGELELFSALDVFSGGCLDGP